MKWSCLSLTPRVERFDLNLGLHGPAVLQSVSSSRRSHLRPLCSVLETDTLWDWLDWNLGAPTEAVWEKMCALNDCDRSFVDPTWWEFRNGSVTPSRVLGSVHCSQQVVLRTMSERRETYHCPATRGWLEPAFGHGSLWVDLVRRMLPIVFYFVSVYLPLCNTIFHFLKSYNKWVKRFTSLRWFLHIAGSSFAILDFKGRDFFVTWWLIDWVSR